MTRKLLEHTITKSSVSILEAPLTQPFTISTGQHRSLANVLFTVELKNGIKGYGEAGIATHITGETVEKTSANLKSLSKSLIGKNIGDYPSISSMLNEALPDNRAAVGASEMAIADALTKSLRIPLWRFFGSSCGILRTDITIVIQGHDQTVESARNFYERGFKTFKVKIGLDEDAEIKKLIAIRKTAPGAGLYLDANQGYTSRKAILLLKTLRKYGIRPELFEQPVPKNDWDGLANVTREGGVVVCADESAQTVRDSLDLISGKYVTALNIKIVKFGMWRAKEVHALARSRGVKLMIGCMMESSLSATAAAHLAAGLGGFDYVDLDTPFFIKRGHDKNPYLSDTGIYKLSRNKPGTGIEPRTAHGA
ncbi:MAG: dipeptide epimerase [Candidatus Omnitrophica bacterium]|nr:dipeptide epimerase [Candidatus Omnitrophota bacterium]